jgi:hypothetical protein
MDSLLNTAIGVGRDISDGVEQFLFQIGEAYASGYPSISAELLDAAKKSLIVGAIGGVAFGIIDAIDTKSVKTVPGAMLASTFIVTFLTFLVLYKIRKDKMFKKFTGQGVIGFDLSVMAGCLGIPAFYYMLKNKTSRVKGLAGGAFVGLVLYVLLGTIPVAVNDSYRESETLAAMQKTFVNCFDTENCTDVNKEFVDLYKKTLPTALATFTGVDKLPRLNQILTISVVNSRLNIFTAIGKTPLFELLGFLIKSYANAKVVKVGA